MEVNVQPIYAREKDTDIHWIGDWAGPRIGLDAVMKKNSQPLLGLEPPIIVVLSVYSTILQLY
jgi:hypothetical protein